MNAHEETILLTEHEGIALYGEVKPWHVHPSKPFQCVNCGHFVGHDHRADCSFAATPRDEQ